MKALFLSLIGLFLDLSAHGQAAPGLYLGHEAFHSDKPDLLLDSVSFDWYVSDEDGYARGTIWHQGGSIVEPMVVCFPGACFLLDASRRDDRVLYFSRMAEVGAICLFRLVRMEKEWVPMRAYNPANGRPFLEGRVPRDREVVEWHLWRPADNAFSVLSRKTYTQWTGLDDEAQIREQEMIQGIRTYNQLMVRQGKNR